MSITGSPPVSLLDSVLNAETTREEIGIAVFNKARKVTEQQGEAMVQLLEQAAPPVQNGRLDAYA